MRAFVLFVMLVLSSIEGQSQSPSQSPRTDSQANQNQSSVISRKSEREISEDFNRGHEAADKRLHKVSDWLLLLFNGLLTASTICLWLVTAKAAEAAKQAARATESSVETMKSTAEMQLRAYVNVCAVGLDDLTKHTYAAIVIKNFGQTPAHDVRIFGRLEVATFPPGDSLPAVEKNRDGISVEPLPPSRETTKHEGRSGVLDETLIKEIREGRKAIYVYGKIMYRDAFGHDQVTTYRYFSGGATGIRGGTMSPHEEGNHAT